MLSYVHAASGAYQKPGGAYGNGMLYGDETTPATVWDKLTVDVSGARERVQFSCNEQAPIHLLLSWQIMFLLFYLDNLFVRSIP